MQEREELLSVVRALAAGLPVDWNEIESSASDESLRASIRELRVISEIAELHHQLPVASPLTPSTPLGHDAALPAPVPAGSGHETWGPFVLLERIGRGSFGEVFRARDPRLDRDIALKLGRHPDATHDDGASMLEEGRRLARVRHANVVTVFGGDRIDGRVGLWMEFIHGRTLAQQVREQGVFAPWDVAEIGVQICHALTAVHHAGLLHRDVKAQNVMRDDHRRLVLMDFGAGRDRLDESHEFAGTPLYLAPEIFDGRAPSVQSDIYSVGVLLYYLLSAAYPVTGRSVREMRNAHRSIAATPLNAVRPHIPAGLARVIDRALTVDPAGRFDSADDMARALAAAGGRGSAARRLCAVIALAAVAGVAGSAALNIDGWRDRVLGRPGRPGRPSPSGGAGTERTFAVRQVLRTGEYSEVGRPSADGRFLPFLDNNADLAVKEVATGRVLALTERGAADEFVDGNAALSADGAWAAYSWITADHAFELRVVPISDTTLASTPRVLQRRTDAEVSPVEWSADGRRLLVSVGRQDLRQEFAIVSTANGAMQTLTGMPERAQWVSLSPDGRFVAFAVPQSDNPRVRDVHVLVIGGDEWPLVQHPANDLFPLWSPEGDRVLFASDRTGALGLWAVRVADGHAIGDPEVVSSDMGRMNPLGVTRAGFFHHVRTGLVDAYTIAFDAAHAAAVGTPQPVAPNYIGSNISSTWSPDGRRVAYVSIRSVVRGDRYSRTLSIRDVDTGRERDLWPALAFFIMPQWSPDGRTVAVRGNDLNGRCCLQLVDVRSGDVTHVPLRDSQATGHYQWSADGRSLLFARKNVFVERNIATGRENELLDVRAAGVDRLTPPPYGRPFEISPDGRWLAFGGWIGQDDRAHTVLEVAPLGGVAAEIARSERTRPMFFQGWTPDGANILFSQPTDKGNPWPMTALWSVPVSGGPPRRAGLEMIGLRDVHMNRDGSLLTFTAGAETGEVRVMENYLPVR